MSARNLKRAAKFLARVHLFVANDMRFDGFVQIFFTIIESTEYLPLRIETMNITNAELRQRSGAEIAILRIETDVNNSTVASVYPAIPFVIGANYTLFFNFTGFIGDSNKEGLYADRYVDAKGQQR